MQRLINIHEQRTRFLMTALLLAALWALCLNGTAIADQLCLRSLSSAGSSIDGVVAPGESTATCSSDSLWPQIGPAHLQPAGSGVEAYMYVARLTSTQKLRIGIDTAGDPDVSDFDNVLFFFDADNSGSWNAGDFALRVYVRPDEVAVPVTSGEACNQAGGTIEYYEFDGANWNSDAGAASQVTVKYAYDYSSPDQESNIWNLELEIPVRATTPFKLNLTAPDYFAMGAFLFADRNQSDPVDVAGQVRVWPSGLTSTALSAAPAIGQYASNVALLQPSAATLVDMNLENVCFDVNFDMAEEPWVINGNPANPYDEFIHRNAVNHFRVTYYFDGPDSSLGELREPNKGKVRMKIAPLNAGSGWGSAWEQSATVTQQEFNRTYTTDFSYDFTHAPNPVFNAANTSMVCTDAYLEEFTMNDRTDNDHAHFNYNYFATSEAKMTLRLFGDSLPKLKHSDINKIYVQFETNNEYPELRNTMVGPVTSSGSDSENGWTFLTEMLSGDRLFSLAGWLHMGLGLLVLLTAVLTLRRARSHRWVPRTALVLGLLLIAGPMVIGCPDHVVKPDGGQGAIGTPRWQVENAKALGLTPVKGQKNLYEMVLNREQVKQLDLKFVGQPLPYKMNEQRLAAAVNGKPNKIDLPVKPGTVVSLLAKGDVDVDGKEGPLAPTTPAGFTRKMQPDLRRAATATVAPLFFNVKQKMIGRLNPLTDQRQRYLLTEGYYAPNEHTGALIGSFDGFKTSFVVGRHSSIIVPAEATTMSLAVNAAYQDYAVMTGEYEIGVIFTEAPKVPTRTVNRGDATYNIPPTIPPWQVYVTLSVYTFYPEPIYRANEQVSEAMRPWGHAHFMVYASHAAEFTNVNMAASQQR